MFENDFCLFLFFLGAKKFFTQDFKDFPRAHGPRKKIENRKCHETMSSPHDSSPDVSIRSTQTSKLFAAFNSFQLQSGRQ